MQQDVQQALSDIADIRARLASSTRFHGFAPKAVAMTGALAFAAATAQTLRPDMLASDPLRYIGVWVAVAVAATTLVVSEGLSRAARMHGAMTDMMIAGTLRQLLPFGAAGAIITFIFCRTGPTSVWMLPGLWQILVALIGFSSLASLPRAIVWPAGWYFLCGVMVLDLASQGAPLSPWMMGLPFAVGQTAVALVLHRNGSA